MTLTELASYTALRCMEQLDYDETLPFAWGKEVGQDCPHIVGDLVYVPTYNDGHLVHKSSSLTITGDGRFAAVNPYGKSQTFDNHEEAIQWALTP